ncbi:MAG TPA: phage major capsid protein [Desulfobacterales bacterium]|nr:phage major capsid protein [Desulfobacterales bacterium]
MDKSKVTRIFNLGEIRSKENRTVEATLSSTYPVKRYDGMEVLSHEPGSVDLSRSPLPLLTAHNDRMLPVGVVEGLNVAEGKMKGVLRFSQNADALWQDVEDGILRNISVGYIVKQREKKKDGYLVTKWMPYECSLVAAPADPSVGIGRNFKEEKENKTMDRNDVLQAKKRAIDEMAELAGKRNLTEEDEKKVDDLKNEIRTMDTRLEMFDAVDKGKEDLSKRGKSFTPEIREKQDRQLITVEGCPAYDRTFAGMFNQGRRLEVNEDEIKRFRASMVEGTPSSGGFAVPDPLAAQWLDAALENEVIRPNATVWPMTSQTRKVPGWDGFDQSAGKYYGGFEMEFLAEEGEGSKQTGKLRLVTLEAKKGAIFCDASSEVVEDGLGFEAQLEMAIKKSLGLGLDYYFLQGVGGGQPLGILNSPGVISVTPEGGQGDTFNYYNLSKMFARMYPAGINRAVFLANPTVLPSLLFDQTVAVGTGGAPMNIFKEQNGKYSLMGRPLYFTSALPAIGDVGDIVFVDLSQYAIGIRREMKLEKSTIPGWTKDLVSYRVLIRVDGQGTWSDSITPKNGDSLSWCVTLGAR